MNIITDEDILRAKRALDNAPANPYPTIGGKPVVFMNSQQLKNKELVKAFEQGGYVILTMRKVKSTWMKYKK